MRNVLRIGGSMFGMSCRCMKIGMVGPVLSYFEPPVLQLLQHCPILCLLFRGHIHFDRFDFVLDVAHLLNGLPGRTLQTPLSNV